STITYRPDITASSNAMTPKGGLGSSDAGSKQAKWSGAVAVATGHYENHAYAWINADADVDAGGDLVVRGDVINRIDPTSLWGVNLFTKAAAVDGDPDYQSSDGEQTLDAGVTVKLEHGYANGGDAGGTYRYIGVDGADIDLGTADYTDIDLWESVPESDGAFALLGTLYLYLD